MREGEEETMVHVSAGERELRVMLRSRAEEENPAPARERRVPPVRGPEGGVMDWMTGRMVWEQGGDVQVAGVEEMERETRWVSTGREGREQEREVGVTEEGRMVQGEDATEME